MPFYYEETQNIQPLISNDYMSFTYFHAQEHLSLLWKYGNNEIVRNV